MLVTFPELLTFEIFAPLLLRLALTAFFLAAASTHLPKAWRTKTKTALKNTLPQVAGFVAWYSGLIELALAAMLAVGFLTQIAGIVAAIYAVKMIVFKEMKSKFAVLAEHESFTYIFIFAASMSLVLLGAGVLAFDLPL